MEKHIYPDVVVGIIYISDSPRQFKITMETYLRKKFRKKYYLQKFCRDTYVSDGPRRDMEFFNELNHFHAEVYKSIILGKVDLNLVFPNRWGEVRHAFELDPDQTSEEERLT